MTGSGLEFNRLLLAWQNNAPASCCAIHIGSGADILAPRQQHSLGGFAVNYTHNHYNNSADIFPQAFTTTLATLQILQPNYFNYNNFIAWLLDPEDRLGQYGLWLW